MLSELLGLLRGENEAFSLGRTLRLSSLNLIRFRNLFEHEHHTGLKLVNCFLNYFCPALYSAGIFVYNIQVVLCWENDIGEI